ncbi:UNVERIFIED_CONTAM: hypothetical protein Slati_0963000 [Sesamum latifolium]|uniref:Uncharacterized protein n=1 Tax=Sesamum latifolium TaxID=2727402 RepID=A0AAW2XQ05_9LAMI
MSSTDESVRFMGEAPGDGPSEATSKRLGPNPPSYTGSRRWSLRQATVVARCLLDEPSEEEGEDEEDEGSSPAKGAPMDEEDRASDEVRGAKPIMDGLRLFMPSFDQNPTFGGGVPNSFRVHYLCPCL